MDKNIEIIPVAIPENRYKRHIANLIEHLLMLDSKINDSQSKEAM